MTDATLAGACGLYCGACGIYRMHKDQDSERLEQAAREVFHCQPEEIRCQGCGGPLDRHWSPECHLLACTRERGVTFCYECASFPCDNLSAFSADHRDIPIANLRRLAQVGLQALVGGDCSDRYAVTTPTRSPIGHPGLLVTLVEGSDYPYVYFSAVAATA
jgi:hypothetical protein